jgi:hypothetical protein
LEFFTLDSVHPEDLSERMLAARSGIAAGEAFELQCRLRRFCDGAYRWHLARALPYCDPQGKVLRWFGTYTDIHEQQSANERLESEVLHRAQRKPTARACDGCGTRTALRQRANESNRLCRVCGGAAP